jgi:hypothetical protein
MSRTSASEVAESTSRISEQRSFEPLLTGLLTILRMGHLVGDCDSDHVLNSAIVSRCELAQTVMEIGGEHESETPPLKAPATVSCAGFLSCGVHCHKISVETRFAYRYSCSVMTTSRMATDKRDGRRLLQPVTRATTAIERRQSTMSDSSVVALWFNEASRDSSERVKKIYRDMRAVRDGFVHLQKMRATSPVEVAMKFKVPPSPDPKWTEEYRETYRALEKRTNHVNKLLSRHTFRPAIGLEVITDAHAAGLTPTARQGVSKLRVGEWAVTEADTALALVRLFLNNELERVAVCEMCAQRWFSKSKSNFRFCSDECREGFYVKSDTYHARKARTQRKYRLKQKREKAFK